MINATINNTVTLTAVIAPDRGGNPAAQLKAPPVWNVDNPELAVIVVSLDGMSATLQALGPVGTVNVSVTSGSLSATTQVEFSAGVSTGLTIESTVS